MRAMKDSGIEWIGEIPADWEVRKVKNIGTFRNGLTYKPSDIVSEGEGTLVLRSSNIQNGNLSLSDNVYVSCKIPDVLKAKQGDILICSRNGSRELIGKNAIISIDADLSFGAFMMIFRCENPRYVHYILNSGIFQYYLNSFLTSTVNQLTAENFGNMKLAYTTNVEEQEKIVGFLDSKCAEIDALIAAKEKTNALLKERRQSIIYEAVTKGLDLTVPMKDSGVEWIGEIPETWEALRLKYCLKGIDSGTSVNSEDRPATTDEYGVLKTSCVYSGAFNPDENKTVLDSEYGRVSCPVKANTLIVSRMNTADLIGACGYVENDYPNLFLPDRLWRLTFQENCLPKYMWYFLSSKYAKNYYASLCTGTSGSMQNISQEQLSSIVFVRPPLEEQNAIVDKLDSRLTSLDAIIGHNERTVEKLKEYRQSLIYEAVTGKVVI